MRASVGAVLRIASSPTTKLARGETGERHPVEALVGHVVCARGTLKVTVIAARMDFVILSMPMGQLANQTLVVDPYLRRLTLVDAICARRR